MNDGQDVFGYRVDLAYARKDNLLFGEQIYRKGAQLWLYDDLARIVQRAAKLCVERHQIRFVLYDGLRPTDAQEMMMRTKRARDNPQWLEPPRLLSPAGVGGHPRGMAIDIGLARFDGRLVDMGTDFDFLAAYSDSERNPAHRQYKHTQDIRANRAVLDSCMAEAAEHYDRPILPLPEEWWDFRLMPEYYNQYAPISDKDLPDPIKMTRKRE